MAKVRRQVEVPRVDTRIEEVEVPDGDPEVVHERFRQAHADKDLPVFLATALRKVAHNLHRGLSLPRALEEAAEQIENIVTGADDNVPGEVSDDEIFATEDDRRVIAGASAEEVARLKENYVNERDEGESFAHYVSRVGFRPRTVGGADRRVPQATGGTGGNPKSE